MGLGSLLPDRGCWAGPASPTPVSALQERMVTVMSRVPCARGTPRPPLYHSGGFPGAAEQSQQQDEPSASPEET